MSGSFQLVRFVPEYVRSESIAEEMIERTETTPEDDTRRNNAAKVMLGWDDPNQPSQSHSMRIARRAYDAETGELATQRLLFELTRQLHVIKWTLLWTAVIVPVAAVIGLIFLGMAAGNGSPAPY